MDPATIITTAGVVGGFATIVATSGKWGKWFATKIGRSAVNEIREQDIDEKSYIGQRFAFDEQIHSTMVGMQNDMRKTHLVTLRVELLQLIQNTPKKAEIIEQVADEYFRAGGNSYMRQVVEEWREIYGKRAIHKELIKRSNKEKEYGSKHR